jgi:hypothetical protein
MRACVGLPEVLLIQTTFQMFHTYQSSDVIVIKNRFNLLSSVLFIVTGFGCGDNEP